MKSVRTIHLGSVRSAPFSELLVARGDGLLSRQGFRIRYCVSPHNQSILIKRNNYIVRFWHCPCSYMTLTISVIFKLSCSLALLMSVGPMLISRKRIPEGYVFLKTHGKAGIIIRLAAINDLLFSAKREWEG